MAEMSDRWLPVDEICKCLGGSKDTFYKWIDKHQMPAHRMGRMRRFKKEQVDAWVEAGGAAAVTTEDHTETMPVNKKLKQSGDDNE